MSFSFEQNIELASMIKQASYILIKKNNIRMIWDNMIHYTNAKKMKNNICQRHVEA